MTDQPPAIPDPPAHSDDAELPELDLAPDDILDAMRHLPGYLDITTTDFQAIYHLAHRHAADRLIARFRAETAMRRGSAPLVADMTANRAARDPFRKMDGSTLGTPPRVSGREILWSWLGAFLGVAALFQLDRLAVAAADLPLLMAPLGASAVLVFGANRSPLAQPRNLIGGHVLSALVGVACWHWLPDIGWLAAATAVSAALALMHATRTLHPPGGATALLAVIGPESIHRLGYAFVLFPTALGALVILLGGLVVNNVAASRRYPELWW